MAEVDPAPEIFEYIIFKGNDIADLTVCDNPAPAPAPPVDPAIVSVRCLCVSSETATHSLFLQTNRAPAPRAPAAPQSRGGFEVPQPLPVGAQQGAQRRPQPVAGTISHPRPCTDHSHCSTARGPPAAAPAQPRGRNAQSTERLGTGELLVQRRTRKAGGGSTEVPS